MNPTAEEIRAGSRRALARAITLAESRRRDHRIAAETLIKDLLPDTGNAIRLGISGVPGVGKKTAGALLKHFGSLEKIYANLAPVHEVEVRGAKTLGAKLETHKEAADLARRLTGIACDAPIENVEEAMQPSAPDLGAINALFDEANIGTALRRQAERVSDIYRH